MIPSIDDLPSFRTTVEDAIALLWFLKKKLCFFSWMSSPVSSYPLPQDHKDEVTCVAYNWNDCYIASGSLSGEIILHSVTTNLSSTPFGYNSSQVGSVLTYCCVWSLSLHLVFSNLKYVSRAVLLFKSYYSVVGFLFPFDVFRSALIGREKADLYLL